MAKSGDKCTSCGKVHGRTPEIINKWCNCRTLCPDCKKEQKSSNCKCK